MIQIFPRFLPRSFSSLLAGPILAALVPASASLAQTFALDPSHSQALFSYDHLGFSTTYGLFSGFEGEIEFNAEDPAASSVSVSIPVSAMLTGWEERDAHFWSDDFLGAETNPTVSFISTAIEVTGEGTAIITGDLTLNGVTKSIDLDTKLRRIDTHNMSGALAIGFDAEVTLLRSDFDLGLFAPAVSDEVAVQISIEAQAADAG
jgi:polyisoprenoid-binding protein YceI